MFFFAEINFARYRAPSKAPAAATAFANKF